MKQPPDVRGAGAGRGRLLRLLADGQWPMAENLADGIALSHMLLMVEGTATRAAADFEELEDLETQRRSGDAAPDDPA